MAAPPPSAFYGFHADTAFITELCGIAGKSPELVDRIPRVLLFNPSPCEERGDRDVVAWIRGLMSRHFGTSSRSFVMKTEANSAGSLTRLICYHPPATARCSCCDALMGGANVVTGKLTMDVWDSLTRKEKLILSSALLCPAGS